MKTKKYVIAGLLLIAVAYVCSAAVSAEETFIRGRGALYAEGEGNFYLNARWGGVKYELTDAVVVIYDYGQINTVVEADGGNLTQYGRTWIFEGSGILITKGKGYAVSGSGNLDQMIAVGKGWVFLDGDFDHFGIGWHPRPTYECDSLEQISEIESVLNSVESGQISINQELDSTLSGILSSKAKRAGQIFSVGSVSTAAIARD
ncbi:hypothetical protein ACFLRC_03740 [Candidatus Altiarchaeota archaeon]